MSDETNRTETPDRLTAMWRRLKEHRIAQWTVGYVAVAYGIQHAVTLTSEAYEWPNAVARLSMTLLALGLPLAMTLAWYHGERASRGFSRAEFSILATLLLGVSILFYAFVQPAARTVTATAPAILEASVAAARQATLVAPAGSSINSVAVLPFSNLSRDPDQEFFSDGMTDEIMSALAKITALHVVGRESAFQFKGKGQDNRTIGRALGARYLVEGSVRKAGDQLRITAQLVRADDGVSLWTDNYDRELKDVFAVQEDVARAIAVSLQAPLGLRQGERLVSDRNIDPESYQAYLRAKALFRLRGVKPLTDAAALLEQVVARDPGYAPAWALLSLSDDLIPDYHPAWFSGAVEETRHVVDAAVPRAEAAARRAIELDPELADGYEALGLIEAERRKLLEAEDLYRKALTFDSNNPDTLHQYSQLLDEVGRFDEALAMRQRLQALEPLVPIYNAMTAFALWLKGENDAALVMLQQLPSDFVFRAVHLSMNYASLGRYRDAANALSETPAPAFLPGVRDEAVRLLRSAPAAAPAQEKLPRLGYLQFVYLYVGAANRVLEYEEGNIDVGYTIPGSVLQIWHPSFAQVRKTERFKALMRKNGLVEYWRARGWPDLCHPTTGDDFECS